MRLVTRADFDGLVCGALLEEIGVVDDFLFVHPKDVQDGRVDLGKGDVLANMPYDKRAGLWFDHHASELQRSRWLLNYLAVGRAFNGCARPAPSCARVIYDYYGGGWTFERLERQGVIDAVDKSDSADFTLDEILFPKGWVLLSFLLDPRTGLDPLPEPDEEGHAFYRRMVESLRRQTAQELLETPEIQARAERYHQDEPAFEAMIRDRSRITENVLVIDLRDTGPMPAGNRFVEFALFPRQNVSIRLFNDPGRDAVMMAVGKSIVNRTCQTDVGSLLLKYGGGGHRTVGTVRVPLGDATSVFKQLLQILKANG